MRPTTERADRRTMPPGTSTVASERSENSVAVGMLLVITTSDRRSSSSWAR